MFLQLPLPTTFEQGEPKPQDPSSAELTLARSSLQIFTCSSADGEVRVRRPPGWGWMRPTTPSHLKVTLILTSNSWSISKVLRCYPDPLTHCQLGLTKPEMTDRKSVVPAPPPPAPPYPLRRGSLGEQGWLRHLQASSCWGSTTDTGLIKRFPGIFGIIPLPSPPSAPSCLGAWRPQRAWRQHRHFRPHPHPPCWIRSMGAHARRQAALARWPGPLAVPSDSPGPSKSLAPIEAPLPSPLSKNRPGEGISKTG